LERKLGEGVTREIPTRPLPYGSEGVQSPTYVKQEAPLKDSSVKNTDVEDSSIKTTEVEDSSVKTTDIEEPSFHGAGAQWEKDEVFPTAQRAALPSEEERDVLET
jgi:glycogenin glucosyltransferase